MNTLRWITAVAVSVIVGVGTAWFIARRHAVVARVPTKAPAQSRVDCMHASDNDWHTFQIFGYDPGKNYTVESQMCVGNEAGDDVDFKRVRVTNDNYSKVFFTFDDDEILRIENVYLLNPLSPQLFIMTGSGGTGDEENWEIISESDGELKKWAKPGFDGPSEKLLRSDEDFCCKDWNLHLVKNEIFLARGIYHKGEGNCCPSRGGVLVQLRAKPGSLELASIRRISPQEYHRWSYSPFCSRCTLQ